MKNFNRISLVLLFLLSNMFIASCTTDDVTEDIPASDVDHRYQIADEAFGEYLLYLKASGVTEEKITNNGTDTYVYYVDTVKSLKQRGALNLGKSAAQITTLQNAGVRTASVKITNVAELRYFPGVNNITLTSNEVTSFNASKLPKLDSLNLNNNFVGTLDVTKNPELKYLRYTASSKATTAQKLYTIDLSKNTKLTYVDLSNHPGAPFPIPAAIYNQLTTKLGVISQ